MREIKFRAWNGNYKQIKKGYGLDLERKRVFLDANLTSWWILNHCELMQYTGLEDKNGMEIYEGDILEYEDRYEIGDYSRTTTKIIVVKSLEHYFKTNNSIPNEISEVIGNIYENPELIK